MHHHGCVEDGLKPDRYQVFLLTCPAPLPFSFAAHPWIVTNRLGIVSRYGVSWRKETKPGEVAFGNHTCSGCRGHLHKDGKTPSEGCEVAPYLRRCWKGRIRKLIEGDADSLAARMADFMERSFDEYPYTERYSFVGPNSNTYIEWVLEHFPEFGMRLPWNAFGKGYKA